MANPPSTTDIVNIISVGPFNANFEFFDYPQQRVRLRFPTIDVEKINPQATDRIKKSDTNHYVFNIRVYQKILGTANEEYPDQEQAEQQILSLLEAAGTSLENHKIIVENKNWQRERILDAHPYHVVSTLVVTVRSVIAPSMTPDGVLVFKLAGSSVDNPPAGDYTYTNVFDVLISDGYRDIHEYVQANPNGIGLPVPYAGGFSGRFVCNIPIKKADIGVTGEKLNQLRTLRSNGEKPDVYFNYTDNDDTPTPASVVETGVKIRVESLDRLYQSGDNVIYRLIGKVVSPSTITAT